MKGAGEQLLARPRLARQEHRRHGSRDALQFVHGLEEERRRAHDSAPRHGALEGAGQKRVVVLQGQGLVLHRLAQLQQLARQRGQDAHDGDVVGERTGAMADAVAGQRADGVATHAYRDDHERHRTFREPFAEYAAGEEVGLRVDILHDHQLLGDDRSPGDAFATRVDAALDLRPREAVGVGDPCPAGRRIRQHDAPPVEAEALRHQLEHGLEEGSRLQPLADPRCDLLDEEHLLAPPERRGLRAVRSLLVTLGHRSMANPPSKSQRVALFQYM